MAVTAAADVPLAKVQAALAEVDQWLAFDGRRSSTLESLVLRDATGPLRLGYGAIRDLLMGVQFRDGRYELITVGGVTVKNVAGYDLVKFLVGSRGCFGTPVSFTSRTYRLPEAAGLVELRPEGDLNALLIGDARPHWVLRTRDGLLAGYLGSARELDALAPVIAGVTGSSLRRRSLADDVAHRELLWDAEALRARAALPPARVEAFVSTLGLAGVREYVADPIFGVVLFDPLAAEAVAGEALRLGGHVFCVDSVRGTEMRVWGMSRGESALLGRLKARFDPDGRLAPLPIRAIEMDATPAQPIGASA